MAMWVWIVLVVAVVVAALAVVAWLLVSRRRSQELRQRFGPEYDRTLREHDTRGEAEAELRGRDEGAVRAVVARGAGAVRRLARGGGGERAQPRDLRDVRSRLSGGPLRATGGRRLSRSPRG